MTKNIASQAGGIKAPEGKKTPVASCGFPWLRLHVEVLDDLKVQRLPPHLFKAWVNLLCLARQFNGVLPSVEDISFRLRLSHHDAGMQIDDLILAGLIDIKPNGQRTPHNWGARQCLSDSSTERVRKFRKTKNETAGNGEKKDDRNKQPETQR